MQKEYASPPADEARRYSPATCTGVDVRVITGNPEPRLISTSYVERQNLTLRMGIRRFTRLTNAFSKGSRTTRTRSACTSRTYFARRHQSLDKATPAMAAGIARHPWSLTQIAELLD